MYFLICIWVVIYVVFYENVSIVIDEVGNEI